MTPHQCIEKLLRAPRRYAGVGSRELPADRAMVIRRLGRKLCDVGWLGQSGEADGTDTEFHLGAKESPRYGEVGFIAFLPWNGFRSSKTSPRIFHNPREGRFDATLFDSFEDAKPIAIEARGSFDGLGPGGICMHTRNVFQVLTPTLKHPVDRLFAYAKPVGNGTKVAGGTNTALQIALRYKVPVTNLYYDEECERVMKWLEAA